MAAQKMTRGDREDFFGIIRGNADRARKKAEQACPNWETEVREKARKMAIGSLKIESQLKQMEKLESEIAVLTKKKDVLESAIQEKMPKEDTRSRYACPGHMSPCEAINEAANRLYDTAKAKHPTGKHITNIDEVEAQKKALMLACTTREEIRDCKCLEW